jgi:hypothetical protein
MVFDGCWRESYVCEKGQVKGLPATAILALEKLLDGADAKKI